MKKYLILSLIVTLTCSAWAELVTSDINYTIDNRSSKSWSGEITVFDGTSTYLPDNKHVEADIILPAHSSIRDTISITRDANLSTRDHVYIWLDNNDDWYDDLYWTSMFECSYPGKQKVNTINCVIEEDASEFLNCQTM